MKKRFLIILLVFLLSLALSGCAVIYDRMENVWMENNTALSDTNSTDDGGMPSETITPEDTLAETNPVDEGETEYYIKVNRKQNCITIYTKDTDGNFTVPVRAIACSTGKYNRSPLGTYKISTKYEWHQLYNGVYGQYCSRIAKHILFHSVPYRRMKKDSLITNYYNKLGTQASSGCIRLTCEDAKWIYDNCPSGTIVEIYDSDDPGPLGKPNTIYLDSDSPHPTWDPTDPDPNNPWKKLVPTITGVENLTIEPGSPADLTANVIATDYDGTALSVSILGEVNTSQCGSYEITYVATNKYGLSASANATVTVRDTTLPTITQVSVPAVNDSTTDLESVVKASLKADDNLGVPNIILDLTKLNNAMTIHSYGIITCSAYAVDANGNQSMVIEVDIHYQYDGRTNPTLIIKGLF